MSSKEVLELIKSKRIDTQYFFLSPFKHTYYTPTDEDDWTYYNETHIGKLTFEEYILIKRWLKNE